LLDGQQQIPVVDKENRAGALAPEEDAPIRARSRHEATLVAAKDELAGACWPPGGVSGAKK